MLPQTLLLNGDIFGGYILEDFCNAVKSNLLGKKEHLGGLGESVSISLSRFYQGVLRKFNTHDPELTSCSCEEKTPRGLFNAIRFQLSQFDSPPRDANRTGSWRRRTVALKGTEQWSSDMFKYMK